MKQVCLYVRVSTDEQAELSPDAQKRLAFEYCKKNELLLTEEDVFMDLGISGRESDNRPEFNRMIATCKSKEHPYDAILVWKFSRFARNQEESIVYKRMLKKQNIDVVSISEPIPEGMMGQLIERILEWMDEYYSINLSQEVTRGMTEKAMRGGYLGSQPFGYTNSKDEKDKIPKPIPHEADIIKYIFDRFVNGNVGLPIIASELNHKGFKTRGNQNWNTRTLQYMVMNPFYIGKTRWNYAKHNKARKINPKEEWIIADAQHEPLVSEEIWQKANEKLEAGRRPTGISGRIPRQHWLSGILRCSECGGTITFRNGVPRKGQSAFFQCRKYINKGCEESQYTVYSKMEEYFFEGLKQCITEQRYTFVENPNKVVELDNTDYLKIEIEDLEKKLKKLNMAFLDDIYTEEEFKTLKVSITSEINKLTLKMENTTSQNNAQIQPNMENKILSLVEYLKDENFSIEQKNEQLKSVVQKVVFSRKNQTMDFYFWC